MNRRLPFQWLLHRGVGEGATPSPELLHFTLDTYLILLSVKQGVLKCYFKIHWYDVNWDWTRVSWTIDEHSIYCANVYIYLKAWSLIVSTIKQYCNIWSSINSTNEQVRIPNLLYIYIYIYIYINIIYECMLISIPISICMQLNMKQVNHHLDAKIYKLIYLIHSGYPN